METETGEETSPVSENVNENETIRKQYRIVNLKNKDFPG